MYRLSAAAGLTTPTHQKCSYDEAFHYSVEVNPLAFLPQIVLGKAMGLVTGREKEH